MLQADRERINNQINVANGNYLGTRVWKEPYSALERKVKTPTVLTSDLEERFLPDHRFGD